MKDRMFRRVALLLGTLLLVACSGEAARPPELGARQEALYDCNDPGQRFTCAAPDDPDHRFLCHATGAADNPYVRLEVPSVAAHAAGVSHAGLAPDQSPGASGADAGGGPGLDCGCEPRVCETVCTGAVPGAACGDSMVCDAGGACIGVPRVTINEIESSGGVPGDWVELTNSGAAEADVSGWQFVDNDDSRVRYRIPAGTTIAVGGFLVLDDAAFGFGLGGADSARLYDAAGAPVDAYSWTAHAPSTYGRCPDGTGGFRATTRVTKGTANDCSVAVVINEIESSGGVPGDWVELYNPGAIAVDLSGWVFKDNDDTHGHVIPTGTTLAAGAFYVLDEAAFGFGIGGADSARLYDAAGAPIDAYSWTAHATATTYGRCPDGTGPFTTTGAATKGTANNCGAGEPPPGPPPGEPWPGANAVITMDALGALGGNMSGLFHASAADGQPEVLWAVRNGPSMLYRLVWDGTVWTFETGTGWDAGKALRYPSGTGDPDAEDMTRAEPTSPAIYVATERDNAVSGVSRLAILRFDSSVTDTTLVATHEWNLTSDLPAVGPNLGLEAITWIPDEHLVAAGFSDERTGAAYAPAGYPDHGGGLFFVGMEANGTIYAYALDHATGGFARVATIASGNPGVMSLWFDREVGYLWSHCDDTCGNQSLVLAIGGASSPAPGRFALRRRLARPSTLPNGNHEGITIAPEAQCVAGQKRFFWVDDSATGGHALRADTVPCGPFIP